MIAIDNKIISDEILERRFVCDLSACKGACCVEGVSGAPLAQHELEILEKEYENYAPYLTEEGKKVIAGEGYYLPDEDGIMKTPLMDRDSGPCAYIRYDNGIALCGIEKAYEEGKTTFKKPISCHLYPIRVQESGDYNLLNYDEWEICDPACSLGKALQVPVYRFLKEPIVRKYGEEFFAALEAAEAYAKGETSNDT